MNNTLWVHIKVEQKMSLNYFVGPRNVGPKFIFQPKRHQKLWGFFVYRVKKKKKRNSPIKLFFA